MNILLIPEQRDISEFFFMMPKPLVVILREAKNLSALVLISTVDPIPPPAVYRP
jgi:hypothetical protein